MGVANGKRAARAVVKRGLGGARRSQMRAGAGAGGSGSGSGRGSAYDPAGPLSAASAYTGGSLSNSHSHSHTPSHSHSGSRPGTPSQRRAHHRPQFLDENHIFWCSACKGDLVIL